MRVHYEDEVASADLAGELNKLVDGNRDTVYVCIGTDRSTGDSLGPLVGMYLQERGIQNVYGTIDDPIHAQNMVERLEEINERHEGAFVVAVDAALGKPESIGYVTLKEGPLSPGSGVGKDLPSVGDIHLFGVVNVADFMGYFVLQNTRLSIVMGMAKMVVEGIEMFDEIRYRLREVAAVGGY